MPIPAAIAAPFNERVTAAYRALGVRYEERGQFLSDSDVLDIADVYGLTLDGQMPSTELDEDAWEDASRDRHALADRLFETLEQEMEYESGDEKAAVVAKTAAVHIDAIRQSMRDDIIAVVESYGLPTADREALVALIRTVG